MFWCKWLFEAYVLCEGNILTSCNVIDYSYSFICLTGSVKHEDFKFVKLERVGEEKKVGLVVLNRPKALNALCDELMGEVAKALDELENDSNVASIVLTGSERAFAAGADIKEMQDLDCSKVMRGNFLTHWNRLASCQKPTIAAVNGFAVSIKL